MGNPLKTDNEETRTLPIYGGNTGPPANLHEASERGLVSAVNRMIAKEIDLDINKIDRLGRTALHWAVDMGHVDVVECLLDYKAKVDTPDGVGRTPVHIAARHGRLDLLKMLLKDLAQAQLAAAVNAADNHGITPVFLAAQRGEDDGTPCIQFLMECGAKYGH